MKPDQFLFDIGNVLVNWNPRHLLGRIIADPKELDFFLEEVCPQSWNEEQDRGRPWKDALEEAVSRHPDYRQTIHCYYDRWLETIAGPIQESVDILCRLRRFGYPVYALSNFSRETFALAEAVYPFLSEFDGRIISGHVGLIKPDPAIFSLAVERFSLTPAGTLFIDDSCANVRAARELGFQTHLFERADALSNQLLTSGVFS